MCAKSKSKFNTCNSNTNSDENIEIIQNFIIHLLAINTNVA